MFLYLGRGLDLDNSPVFVLGTWRIGVQGVSTLQGNGMEL